MSHTPDYEYHLDRLLQAQAAGDKAYHEFLRVPDMSAGLYVLPAGGTDPQQPHNEDEMYCVLRGRGRFFCDGQDYAVSAGSVLYVPKHVEHRFHSIEEELAIVVIFAPQET